VDEGGVLVVEFGPKRPSNGNASGEITFRGRESVRSGGRLEEEIGQEDKDIGEDASALVARVHTESVKGSDEDKESRESVPQGEGQVDEYLIIDVLGDVMLPDDIVDVGDSRADEESKDEGDDVVTSSPDVDVDGVEEDEEGEAPADSVDDGLLAALGELVDDSAEKQEVNDGPDTKDPAGGGEVGLFTSVVVRMGTSDRVYACSEEEDVCDYVDDFEEDTVCPLRHDYFVWSLESWMSGRGLGE